MKFIVNNFEAILEDYWGPLEDLGPLVENHYTLSSLSKDSGWSEGPQHEAEGFCITLKVFI